MGQITSFLPIIDEKCLILILGSIPGAESLRKGQYYAYTRNQFWRIVYSLFNMDVAEKYEERKSFLIEKKIGLWDVIKTCKREGSSDSKIREAETNDFENLLKKYPDIKYICFNGKKAYEIFQKNVWLNEDIVYIRLESTSPANTKSFDEKLKNWMVIKTVLNLY